MAELHIGGEAFHVEIEGDEEAPVLMLSNVLGTTLHMWDPQMPALLKHYRVLRYDARGHGDSVVSEGPYSVADLGQDALNILDTLGLGKVDFIGLSLGGAVGEWLLSHAPKRIGKAVLANTAAQLGNPDMWNSRIEAVLQDGMSAAAPSLIDYWFTKSFREDHADKVAWIEDMILKTPPHGYAASCAALRDMDLREAIRSIQAPVLVLVGRNDSVTPPGIGALVASAIPNAKLVTLDTAHLSNVGEPEQFAEKALEFLLAEEPAAVPEPEAEIETALEADLESEPKPAPETELEPEPAADVDAEPAEPEAVTPPSVPKPPRKPRVPRAKKPVETPVLEVVVAPEPEPAPEPPAPKTVLPKTPAAKKAPVKKAAVKKAPAKKAAAKKLPAKKVAVKKAASKKAAPKKAVPKKAVPKKALIKKATPKKAAPQKAPIKKLAVKKAVTKKGPIKKIAVKKAAVKKTATKKLAVKKSVVKKTVAKKAPAKKIAVKKAVVKKGAVKKAAVKKSTAKKAVKKPPLSRKTGPAKVARKPVKKAAAKKAAKRR